MFPVILVTLVKVHRLSSFLLQCGKEWLELVRSFGSKSTIRTGTAFVVSSIMYVGAATARPTNLLCLKRLLLNISNYPGSSASTLVIEDIQ